MRKKIIQLFALLLIAGLVSCGHGTKSKKSPTGGIDNYKPAYTAASLKEKLEQAYEEESGAQFDQFFIGWNANVPPNSKDFIEQNDTIRAIYEAYKTFYQPRDLLKLGEWEWGNKLNEKSRYVAIQNKLFFTVLPSDTIPEYNFSNPSKLDSISSFRPPVNIDQKKVLYLTPEYSIALNQFLGSQSTELGEPDIMDPSRAKDESEKRYNKIRPYIPVLHGHWGGYWHLNTHPDVSYIEFNKDLTVARFVFRTGYQGGEAVLKKTLTGWTIQESKATWIE